jgi:3-phenylpropionate/cinnamic acid dioxygenase small subunit
MLSTADRLAIHELMNLHGHLMDDGAFDRLDELFTSDVVYDVSAFGVGKLVGIDAIRAAALALGDRNPLGHHVTNIVIVDADTDVAHVRSKGLGVRADGTTGSLVHDDTVRRTASGWRIASRTITPRRKPLQP